MKKLNKNGFTMIELLAVITLLGILSILSISSISGLIEKSRKEEADKQKKIAILAAKSYMQFNKGRLPQTVGATVQVKFMDLKNSKFLKDNIKSPSGISCMNSSYVTVKKESTNKYTYSIYMKCGNKVY